MAEKTPAPRGEAAWQAAKAEIAKRNDAARATGAARRAADGQKAAAKRDREDRLEESQLPEQPRP